MIQAVSSMIQLGLSEHFTPFCFWLSLPAYPIAPNVLPPSPRKQQRGLQDPIQTPAVTCHFGATYTHSLKAYVPQVPNTLSFIVRPTLPTLRSNGLDLWGLCATLHPQPIPLQNTGNFICTTWYRDVLVSILLLWQNQKPQREKKRVYLAYAFRSQPVFGGSHGRNSIRKLKQKPWINSACWLTHWLILNWLASPHNPNDPPRDSDTHKWTGLPTPINKTTHHRHAHRPIDLGKFPTWGSDGSRLCQVGS